MNNLNDWAFSVLKKILKLGTLSFPSVHSVILFSISESEQCVS